MVFIGAELSAVEPGRAEIRLPYRSDLTQHNGYFHGGIIGTLADNAGGSAAYSLLPADKGALTVEFKVNIIAPGQGQWLVARGEVVRSGRTLVVSRSNVFAVKDGNEKHCATCLMTLAVVTMPAAA